jgi:hypothetical protein
LPVGTTAVPVGTTAFGIIFAGDLERREVTGDAVDPATGRGRARHWTRS